MRFEVQPCVERIATEDHRRPRLKLESFLYEVLNGHRIFAIFHIVVAEHLESALIKICGSHDTIAVEIHVVASCLVHQHPQCEVGSGVDNKIHDEIAGNIVVVIIVSALTPRGTAQPLRFHSKSAVGLRCHIIPVDERVVVERSAVSSVVLHERLANRGDIGVDGCLPRRFQ